MYNFAFFFEVMDKEPELIEIWLFYAALAVIGFSLARFRSWLLAIVFPINVLLGLGWLTELHDQYVGPAILREAGDTYVFQSYVAIVLAVAFPWLGAILSWKQKIRMHTEKKNLTSEHDCRTEQM